MQRFLASTAAVMAFVGFSQIAWAAAQVESVTGDVNVQRGQRLESGVTVRAGAGSNAVLRFDDGQVVVLNQNTVFRIADYKYDEAKPKEDRSVLELVTGALRFISGAISKRNQESVKVQTGTATIGIRGTDFMAATGSLAVSVGQGAVSITSGAGMANFSAGQIGFVSSATTMPVAVTATQLPASISAAFSQLGSIPVAGVSAAAGSGGVSGGAASGATAGSIAGVSTGAAVAVGAVVVGVAAVAAQDNNNAQSQHSHH